MDKQISYERYHRQLILKDFGEAAQQKLLNAKLLVVGAGGLGCPALQYLAAAGIGTIGVVDNDIVALSNLHRQILYSVADVGQSKAKTSIAILSQLNPDIDFHAYDIRLTVDNVAEIFRSYDFILDGSDNFATRYLVNDACVLLDKTLIYGAVAQYEGQVAIFNCKTVAGAVPVNYRDLFPEPPADDEILNCEEAGVLGVVPGIIGTMMANEAIKLITGVGSPAIDKMITYDARNNKLYEIELTAVPGTRSRIPDSLDALMRTNYEWLCSANSPLEINNELFNEMLQAESVTLIDVRESTELPRINQFEHLNMPLSLLEENATKFSTETIVLFCQSGKRSLQAAQNLHQIFGDSKKIYSLRNGIVQWLQQQKQMV